jgi:3-hydroxyacyl-CoA dehydrogenase
MVGLFLAVEVRELAMRASDFRKMMWNECFTRIFHDYCYCKVSTSAYEAFDTGLLHGKDIVVVNKDRQIAEAKTCCLMAEAGYTQ